MTNYMRYRTVLKKRGCLAKNLSISDNQSTSSRIVNEVLDFEGGSADEDLPEGNAAPDPNDLVGPGIESQKVFLFFISAG